MSDLTTRLTVAAASQGGLSPIDASVGEILKGAPGSAGQVLTKQDDGSATFAAASGVQIITRAISNLELQTANSVPIDVVAAPGAGLVLAPFLFIVTFTAGDTPFGGSGAPPSLIFSGFPAGPILAVDAGDPDSNQPFQGGNDQVMMTSIAMGVTNAQGIDTALQFETAADLGAGSGTATVTVGYIIVPAPT